ncbi:ubiquitin thioesterase trabid-like [Uranotaenia lowii]|uniref:ubiquitin thioesterase trabid-like n=1 Tax=Uranotaenia lowii TaxID=190385 RepID=UPI00247A1913|nr:ubiquitin thioesterase trabid-like [Uranotaenia lowii]XP_055601945.1 ubiquitin thioesterase trabid-like [Uranotaenia lowii]XP_055601946.1 ubiquitin thioesterase trabid-like [Uranotaenia lowii]XP_055601947.1 ubiquitin thioesterase trabid-like [Uranotaenia lowii]
MSQEPKSSEQHQQHESPQHQVEDTDSSKKSDHTDESRCIRTTSDSSPQHSPKQQRSEQPDTAVESVGTEHDLPGQSKWICEYCTYENYPLSLKCTMCRGQKPLLNEDIFRLSPTQQLSTTKRSTQNLASGPSKIHPGVKPEEEGSASKWSCSACTYHNHSQTRRCIQCNSKRDDELLIKPSKSHVRKPSPPKVISEYENLSEQLNALNISRSMGEEDALDLFTPGSHRRRNNSPATADRTLDSEQGGAKHQSPTSISPVNTCGRAASGGGKWYCSACTYENWPKSTKCSMCLHPRETNSSRNNPVASTKSSPELDENVASNIVVNNKRNQQIVRDQEPMNNLDMYQQERYMRQLRRQPDWQWLNACIGVAENNVGAVESYLGCGGDPGRALSPAEVTLLNNNDIAFDVGHTLIHLAIRFHRDEMLPLLLAQISGSGPGIKRVPSYVAPDLASDIRRHFVQSLRIRKASFNCQYVNEHATFSLPADIEELPLALQEQLFEELLDRDAQKQLELPPPALNWSLEITERLGSRLMVLWNRSAGDCLLDSAMQATWGVFDRDNTLRRALADCLHQCGRFFYPRWKENEILQAAMLHYTVSDSQLEEDWSTLLSLASHPGSSLEQLHIFALAHILRRPIVVYGVKCVKSFRGEDIGYARFEGVYLPLLWEHSFCITSPIALGYTRGHFSALVPTEPYSRIDAARDDREDITFLPLMDCEMKLLPIHFLNSNEIGREESIMRQWLEVCETEGGLLVAQQKLHKRPLLVAQMLEEWLNHYRRIAISRLF